MYFTLTLLVWDQNFRTIHLVGIGIFFALMLVKGAFVFAAARRRRNWARWVYTTRYKLPTIYQASLFPKNGGLLSYGPSFEDTYHRAAGYVDRVLRGTKPADLPVQLPVKFEMILNRKTANALGLTVPPSILLLADEIIE